MHANMLGVTYSFNRISGDHSTPYVIKIGKDLID